MADPQNSEKELTRINRELEEKATQERAKDLNLPYVDIAVFPLNPDILAILPEETARRTLVMPFYKIGKKLRAAVADPASSQAQEALKELESKGFQLFVHIASASGIQDAFRHYASEQYRLKVEAKNIVKEEDIRYEEELKNVAELAGEIAKVSAEEGLNLLNVSAIKTGASDVHYQPEENGALIRFRIDGVLHTVFTLPREVYSRIAGQLKFKAGMKLNVTGIPQDGRYHFNVNERKVDVRVSSLPTEFGEAFACRILDSGKHFGKFEDLGFSGRTLALLNNAADITQGMVLITGPTSSGKTTTLYVLLQQFNNPELKTITLEDPIEYHLAGIIQSQVNEKKGYDFAAGLRSILRQDPDIVMVGEIRDLKTAEVATQAALTGHVMLSTLHTNSAVDAIPRFITIGVPAFTLAPALSLVVAQRLVRRLCACADSYVYTEEEKTFFSKILSDIRAVDSSAALEIPVNGKKPKGCEQCSFTGYRGQMVVAEAFSVDGGIEDAILKGKSAPEILQMVRKNGMLTMFEDAILKVLAGQTTLPEVHRIIAA